MRRWTDKALERLRELAALGEYASAIAVDLGTSHASILTMAGRHGIDVVKYTPEEQAEFDRRYRAREARKNAKRKAAARTATPVFVASNKTSAGYRNCLPKMPEMTKGELRAMLAEAVRNTAGAAAQ